jgi:hypothetical protein
VTLDFPNPCRSFDEVRNAVRFIGHDGMFEVRFFVKADALAGTGAKPSTREAMEAACLAAFDRARAPIYDVARKLYLRGRQTNYVITVGDLR